MDLTGTRTASELDATAQALKRKVRRQSKHFQRKVKAVDPILRRQSSPMKSPSPRHRRSSRLSIHHLD